VLTCAFRFFACIASSWFIDQTVNIQYYKSKCTHKQYRKTNFAMDIGDKAKVNSN
jgi:hypothetical protein